MKVATIAEYIERTDRATRNILAKLERLGMIARVSRNRPKTGGRGANIIIIKPFLELETSEPTSGLTSERAEADNLTDAKEPATNSEKEPLRKLAKNNTFVTNTYPTGVSTYSAVKQAITTFLGEDSQPTISRLYGVYLGQTKPLRATEYYSTEGKAELISAVITAIQETFKATKRIPIRNLAGYFNGVLSNKLDDLMAEAMQATGL
ncbi:hypothetical protein [Gracilibacillus salinarum]|uniref:Helix-turn-helix domain-containing protein n=1 Tax=Gracilibacillus salinarum TaxID=2932255 RepID=A0ABY4GSK5_9BACI|nr:hypothetical protein [Gracilibacillus salinarum]UOQ86212.1 hypothetical protein MUN87_04755 [Gracilibacillus salinarum]